MPRREPPTQAGRAAPRLLDAAATLRERVEGLAFAPKAPYAYNPLQYAWDPHARFLAKYGHEEGPPRRALFLGMNPGYHGMAQTGIPFADAPTARAWMGIEGRVAQPARPHPKRPIPGFACPRRDPSGTRFYAWARERSGTAERFFADVFVLNYCPLVLFDAQGKNVTPAQLSKGLTAELFAACDEHLAEVVRILRPARLIGMGVFAQARARAVAASFGLDVPVEGVPHPSPANPANNRGWDGEAGLRRPRV